ncbi:HPP family protein [Nocardioides sp. MH1]|uniref:CBS domain-containing protein n=1 Tax=Nocardioides sp. MH1 TaxID=3242490 RepID=UPI003520B48D
MTASPVTVSPDATLKAALRLLDDNGVTSLPVVDDDGVIVGMVSEADLIRELVPADPRMKRLLPPVRDPFGLPEVVAEVMSPHAVTIRPEDDVATAVGLMTSTTIKSLPVVDRDQHVVGMISRRDVVRTLARSDESLQREVDAFLTSCGLAGWLVEVSSGIVDLTGPADVSERAIAPLLARTVPGVLEVRVS